MLHLFKNRILRKLIAAGRSLKHYHWEQTHDGIESIKRLNHLHGKYKNTRCFIMANGPSLLQCDLTLLRNEITIASNAQFLIWGKMGFIPTFLTVEDRLVAEDRANQLNEIQNTTKIFPSDLSYCLLPDQNTIYINFLRKYDDFPRFSDEFAKRVYWGGTVSFLNLQLAYYLGCNPIYLIGFDHNYQVTGKIENHIIKSETDDVNHIHPDYFGKGYRWHDPNVERMELAYKTAKKFFEEKNIDIFNATVKGMLDVFERKRYEDLFTK